MPRHPAAREARQLTPREGRDIPWARRFLRSLGARTGEHDRFVRLIIAERIVKAIVLIAVAVCLLVFGRNGQLTAWILEVEYQLNLDPGRGVISRFVLALLDRVVNFRHTTVLGSGLIAYAVLEGTEGAGLYFHRRWAEYLTVFATGFLIPYELLEVVSRPSLFKVGALVLNVAVVVYLAWKKRLFVDV